MNIEIEPIREGKSVYFYYNVYHKINAHIGLIYMKREDKTHIGIIPTSDEAQMGSIRIFYRK